MSIGQTWWPDVEEGSYDYIWRYPRCTAWFSSILQLDDVENIVLRGLKFLDTWQIIGTPEWPAIRDRFDMDWLDDSR